MANTIAYGFLQMKDLFGQRIADVDGLAATSWQAVLDSAAFHTQWVNQRMAGIVERTTDYTRRFRLPGTGELQPLDENGSPRPVITQGYFDVAFPIESAGTAWGTNRISRALITVEELNNEMVAAQVRDANFMKRRVLAALFANAGWNFVDPFRGTLAVKGLLAADVTIPLQSGVSGTPQHYTAQANAIDDSNNPFPAILALLEAPMGNSGPFVSYIPSGLRGAIENLQNFRRVADPNIQTGLASDTLIAPDSVRGIGDMIVGYVDGVFVVEWKALPANYIVSHATGAGPFIAQREYPAAELQGFNPELDPGDGNLVKTKMIRHAGFGVMNRAAASVHRVGDGSYAIPTGYAAPLGG